MTEIFEQNHLKNFLRNIIVSPMDDSGMLGLCTHGLVCTHMGWSVPWLASQI